jgi:hypothetical protein
MMDIDKRPPKIERPLFQIRGGVTIPSHLPDPGQQSFFFGSRYISTWYHIFRRISPAR